VIGGCTDPCGAACWLAATWLFAAAGSPVAGALVGGSCAALAGKGGGAAGGVGAAEAGVVGTAGALLGPGIEAVVDARVDVGSAGCPVCWLVDA
jgi:hypothetical protein